MEAHAEDPGQHRRGHRFDPGRAARLDDPERLAYLAPEWLARLVDAPPDAVVLDFGTGTGTYAIAFAYLRPDCRVLAVDVQPEMLAALRAKPDAALVESGGPELLRRYAKRIDRTFALNVLHELTPTDLVELFDAQAPQAKLLFADWNPEVERPTGPAPEHLYAPAEASAHLARFGLRVEREERWPYHYVLLGALDAPA